LRKDRLLKLNRKKRNKLFLYSLERLRTRSNKNITVMWSGGARMVKKTRLDRIRRDC
jgi:hypothetical protein